MKSTSRGFDEVYRAVGVDAKSIELPFDEWVWGRQREVCAVVAPDVMATALAGALDAKDARTRQSAVRLLLWWADCDGSDGHGGAPPRWLADWYRAIGARIAAEVEPARLAAVIARDLDGAEERKAASSLTPLGVMLGKRDGAAAIVELLSDPMVARLRRGDWAVRDAIMGALWHFLHLPGVAASWRRRFVAPIVALLEALASRGGGQELDAAERGFLHPAVLAMAELRASEAIPALLRLAGRHRRTRQEDLWVSAIVDFLCAMRAPGALPLLEEILRDGAGSMPSVRAKAGVTSWLSGPPAGDLAPRLQRALDAADRPG